MRVVMFCHSLLSDWNHGNAHCLRGIATELLARGHDVRIYDPRDAWSLQNLIAEQGEAPIQRFHARYPGLTSTRYHLETLGLDHVLDGANLVLVHEWNDPLLIQRIAEHRRRLGGYPLLFQNTHHRSVTDPTGLGTYNLTHYDGVLAFGMESPLRIVLLGLSIASSWGNGHATTYRGLVRELGALGHEVLFPERDVPWYAANRDLHALPSARIELYSSLQEHKDRFAGEVRSADVVMVGSYVPEGVAVGEWVTTLDARAFHRGRAALSAYGHMACQCRACRTLAAPRASHLL